MNTPSKIISFALYLTIFCACTLVFAERTVPREKAHKDSEPSQQENRPAAPSQKAPQKAPVAPKKAPPAPSQQMAPSGNLNPAPEEAPGVESDPTIEELMKKNTKGLASFPIHINNSGLCQATLIARRKMTLKNGNTRMVCVASSAKHCFSYKSGRFSIATPKVFFGKVNADVWVSNHGDAAVVKFSGPGCATSEARGVPVFPLKPPGKKIPKGSKIFWSSNPANNCGALFTGRAVEERNGFLNISTYASSNTKKDKRGRVWKCGGREGDSGGGIFMKEDVEGIPNYYYLGDCSTREGSRHPKQNFGFARLNYYTNLSWTRSMLKKIVGDEGLGVVVRPRPKKVLPDNFSTPQTAQNLQNPSAPVNPQFLPLENTVNTSATQ